MSEDFDQGELIYPPEEVKQFIKNVLVNAFLGEMSSQTEQVGKQLDQSLRYSLNKKASENCSLLAFDATFMGEVGGPLSARERGRILITKIKIGLESDKKEILKNRIMAGMQEFSNEQQSNYYFENIFSPAIINLFTKIPISA